MAFFDERDKLQKWQYHLTDLNLILPNEAPIPLPKERLVSLNISEEFEESYFPVINLSLNLESSVYYKILKNKNTCFIHLRMDKYYFFKDNPEKSLLQPFINDKFSLIMDEGTDDMEISIRQSRKSSSFENLSVKEENELDKIRSVVKLYLFKSEAITGSKTSINKVLSNCNVTDALVYLATQANLKNLLMAPADNITVYPNLVIPPMTILKAFSFIDTYYGIYRSGTIIYFGLFNNYIIPYTAECKAFTPREIQNVSIIVPKSNGKYGGGADGTLSKPADPLSHYIVANYKSLNISNESISNDYIDANNIQVIDTYDGTNKVSSSNATTKSTTGGFTRTFENNTENQFVGEIYTNLARSKSTVITMTLRDYDIAAIAPNKKYAMMFEDPAYTDKYKGVYLISKAIHTFTKNGEDFSISSDVVVKRMNTV